MDVYIGGAGVKRNGRESKVRGMLSLSVGIYKI